MNLYTYSFRKLRTDLFLLLHSIYYFRYNSHDAWNNLNCIIKV